MSNEETAVVFSRFNNWHHFVKIQISSILLIFLLCNLEAIAAAAANDSKPSDQERATAPAAKLTSTAGKQAGGNANANNVRVNNAKDNNAKANNTNVSTAKANSAKEENSKEEDNTKADSTKAASVKSTSKTPPSTSKKKGGASAAQRKSSFVPPPPPTVPTLSQIGMPGANIIFMGENVELLPLADVKDLQTKTESDLSKARRSLDEEITVAAEKKQRADSFDQLYAEGVVSRRELESSKTENEKATQDLADAKSLVYNLEQKYARIEKRLAELEKAKKSSSASAKAGTKHRSKN
jgi:hypothetical protein